MRRALVLLACFLAPACKERTADLAEMDAGAKTVHGASPVDDTPTHDKGSIAPTDKPSQDDRPAADGQAAAVVDAGPPMPVAETPAEVEVLGVITGIPKDATVYISVSKKACKADDAELEVFGREQSLNPANFFIEVFVPQGSEGFLCVYALNKDNKLVAFGTGDKNPMKMQGHGEVMFPDTKVVLKPMKARAPPKGLL